MKCLDNVKDPSYFPASLPDCRYHVSFKRYSPLSVEIVEKPNKCKSFLAPFFLGDGWTTPTVLQQIVSAIYHPPQWSRMQNLHRVGKDAGRVWSCLWTKVREILGRCKRCQRTWPIVYVSFWRCEPLKLPLSCEVVQKDGFWAPAL